MRKIIAVGHQKNVGKDQFVKFCIDVLRSHYRGAKILRRGFADKLYDICHLLYGWAGFQTRQYYADHPYAKETRLDIGKTVRQVLIEVGQHMRAYDSDVWINANLKAIDFDILFVTDLRFPNEFLHCMANNAMMLLITRPGLVIPTDEADTALNGWDGKWNLQLHNEGDLQAWYTKAENFVKEYLL